MSSSFESSTSTEKFLNLVLPREGIRCIVIFEPGSSRPRQEFHEDDATAAARIVAHDRAGRTVYHACATFRERGNRTTANVHRLASFWLDVDAGPGKPYADALAAEEAVLDFCTWHEIPDPLLVRSGRGVHAYWLLDSPLGLNEWKPYADGLKALCHAYALHADPARTGDAASILRPVGSHHRKDPADVRRVSSDLVASRHDFRAFDCFRAVGAAPAPAGLGQRPAHLAQLPKIETGKLFADDRPDAGAIAQRCAQMRALRDPEGPLSEPIWRAALGVLAVQNEHAAHDWSAHDVRYDQGETQRKLDATRAAGPTTCKHFGSLNPAGCHGCAYRDRITSPIQLGRPPYTARKLGEGTSKDRVDLHGLRPPEQPEGYTVSPKGLSLGLQDNNDTPVEKIICDNPLFLKTIALGEKSENAHVFVFQHYHPMQGWAAVTVPILDMLGRLGAAALGAEGVIIQDTDAFKMYVKAAASLLQKTEGTKILYEQFGWKEDQSFFVGKRLYQRGGPVTAPAIGEAKQRERYFAVKGTLDAWTAAADRLFAPGCESQGFALMCAFAAPLMRFSSDDEGGAVVSFVSRESGRGKSTAFGAAASVWGDIVGLEIKNTATENARGITFGALGHLPVIFDEATQRDPDELRRFLEIFTSGRDRMRAQGDGTMRHRSNFWQTILLCGANTPMVETLRSGIGSDAMAYRVFEVQAGLAKDTQHIVGERLKQDLKANAGNAGDRFLRYLTEIDGAFDAVHARVQTVRDQIYGREHFKREHRFWVRLLAAVQVASEIVTKIGVLHFSTERLMDWAFARAEEMVDPDLGRENRAPTLLAEYMSEVSSKIVTVRGPARHGVNIEPLFRITGHVVGRYETETGRLAIASKPFRLWLTQRDFSAREILDNLARDAIVTEMNKLVTLVAGTPLPGGQVSSIVINGQHAKFRYMPVAEDGKVVAIRGGKR